MLAGLPAGLHAAQSVQLAWDPSPDSNVAGYVVHYGTSSGQYPWTVDVGGRTMAIIPGLTEGVTYYLAVTAYNTNRIESIPSNELSYQVPPLPAGRLELIRSAGTGVPAILRASLDPGRQYQIQASSDLKNWTMIDQGIVGSQGVIVYQDQASANLPRRFYRLNTVTRDIPGSLAIRTLTSNPGSIAVSFSVRSGLGYSLQASSDLIHWTTLLTGTNTSEAWRDFHDLGAVREPMRFYRLQHP
jgi:hypothetical protein